MTNKELYLISQLTEIVKTVSELKAENKILKEINERLLKKLETSNILDRKEQLFCYICKKNAVEVEDDICRYCAD